MTAVDRAESYKQLTKIPMAEKKWPRGLWMAGEGIYAYSGTDALDTTHLQLIGIKSVVCLHHSGCLPEMSAKLARANIDLVERERALIGLSSRQQRLSSVIRVRLDMFVFPASRCADICKALN